jgi:hypothetical protein
VAREIDALARLADPGEGGIHGALDGGDEGDDGAVVRRIRRDIEHRDAVDGGDRGADRVGDFGAPALGKIRNALYEHRKEFGERGMVLR